MKEIRYQTIIQKITRRKRIGESFTLSHPRLFTTLIRKPNKNQDRNKKLKKIVVFIEENLQNKMKTFYEGVDLKGAAKDQRLMNMILI